MGSFKTPALLGSMPQACRMNSLPPTPDSLKAVVLVGGGTQPGESGQHFICHGNSTHEYTMHVSLLVFLFVCFFACKYVCVSYV